MMLKYYSFCSLTLSLLLLCDTTVRCTVHTLRFDREASFNDKICTDSERIADVFAKSTIVCSKICGENPACLGLFYNADSSSCTICSGYNNMQQQQQGTVFFAKQGNLEGKQFRIIAKETNTFWHFDGSGAFKVSSLYQPNDNYVKFMFEKQVDSSYKIKSAAVPIYIYDGFLVAGAYSEYLNGVDNTDDDHMRYLVTMVTPKYYRIQTKATGRYVRLDPDNYVSSRENIMDDRSLFEMEEM